MLRLMPRPLQFAFQSAGPQPARSLSGRLCRDASSPLPPSPDVGKFIRGAAFPTARAGLRRPQMRSAAECSRPAALFRPPDGFSARPGNVAAPCGGVHSGSGDEPPAPHSPGGQAPPRAPQLRPYSSPEAPSPSRCGSASPARRPECMRLVRRCVPLARSTKFARAQPAAFARIMRYARPLRMFAYSETAPHET